MPWICRPVFHHESLTTETVVSMRCTTLVERTTACRAGLHDIAPLRLEGRISGLSGLVVDIDGLSGHVSVGDRLLLAARRGREIPAEIVGFRHGYRSRACRPAVNGPVPRCATSRTRTPAPSVRRSQPTGHAATSPSTRATCPVVAASRPATRGGPGRLGAAAPQRLRRSASAQRARQGRRGRRAARAARAGARRAAGPAPRAPRRPWSRPPAGRGPAPR